MYKYGLIGNCQISALIGETGTIDWLCVPRPDSPPVFGRLLDGDGGHFSIEGEGKYCSNQYYLPNTVVLVTTLESDEGAAFRITDFCPRFYQHGRKYRPNAVFRIVEPLRGSPQIKVRCAPVTGWEKEAAKPIRGNSHITYDIRGDSLRLITNMPLTYLTEQSVFSLKEPLYFGLTWGFGVEEDLPALTNRFLQQTIEYWETWVKHCSIPSLYQHETIRSALTLKLHCYEDTGAILAGLTTSLPEELGSGRNWDYRYCWLRDAYYVLTALHNLGHFEEMEGFVKFLLNIAEKHEASRERLHPVYRLDQSLPLPELIHDTWMGFSGSQPVRTGNQAAEHIQNDVYGEMVLTLTPIFCDERFQHLRTRDHEELLINLAKLCAANIDKADAGLWEIRDGWRIHSFSNLMCWAGLERVARIRERGLLRGMEMELPALVEKAQRSLLAGVKEGYLRNGPGDPTLDAALLQMATLRFPEKDIAKATVLKIHEQLRLGDDLDSYGLLYRYIRPDDFGTPQSAFLICSFWLVEALVKTGELEEARKVMASAMKAANGLGLFSEHYLPKERRQIGNFPQAYSHVGQINAAFAVSPSWADIL
jgi:GH15 family glucan-1,4-alpha-glucosidase